MLTLRLCSRAASLGLLLATAAATQAQVPPGLPLTDSIVRAVALSPDGQTLYVGGQFSYLGPLTGPGGARLSPATGAVEPVVIDGARSVTASVPDGAGGYYVGVQLPGQAAGARVVHVRPDGTLDPAFDAHVGGSHIDALALGGATLYVGGQFSAVNGQPRSGLAAVRAADGAVVDAFEPGGSLHVWALALDGETLYIGGQFVAVGGQPREGLAAVRTADGGADLAFVPNVRGEVHALALGGGTLYAGGAFRVGARPEVKVAAFRTADGSVVEAFAPTVEAFNGSVDVLALDGATLYVVGDFSTVNGQPRGPLVALYTADGTLVDGFNPDLNGYPYALLLDGGTLYVGGNFTRVNGQVRPYLAALRTADGALVDGFDPGANGAVRTLSFSGGALYAGGEFASIGGQSRAGLAAVRVADGTVVDGFDPNVEGQVYALWLDGETLYVGGRFAGVGGQPRADLAAVRIADGAVVDAFDPNVEGGVNSSGGVRALLLDGGTLYAGGLLTSVGGQSRMGLAAVRTTDGTVVDTFDPNVDGSVYALARDGAILYVGGGLTSVGGQARSGLAAVRMTDGAVVDGFDPNVTGFAMSVDALVLDGPTLYVGGRFVSVGGQPRRHVAAVHVADGAVVEAFDAGLQNGFVRTLALGGGRLYVGGQFSTAAGQPLVHLAAVQAADGTLAGGFAPSIEGTVQALALDGETLYVGGSGLTAVDVLAVGVEGAPVPTDGLRVGPLAPNPARDHAVLRLHAERDQRVRVEVYTTLGQRVATVYDGALRAGTPASIEIDTRRLAAGTYLVRARGDGRASSRLLTVVR